MLPCKLGLTGPNDSVVCRTFSVIVTSVYTTLTMSDFPAFVIIFLSLVCLSKRPFLYDVISGSLKTSLNNGCCCAKCHLLIRIFLGFGCVGYYHIVQNGKI